MSKKIDVTIVGSAADPRERIQPPAGVRIHYAPPLHPEDMAVVDGIPVTSLARTLVDLAEIKSREELCAIFLGLQEDGRLDIEAVQRCRDRLEWRPSLALVDEMIAEFR